MKATVTSALLVACAALILNACLPVLVGGGIYNSVKKKQSCKDLLLDPDFAEKMQVEEFRVYYEKYCPKIKDKKESEKDRCRGLADTSARALCLDELKQKKQQSKQERCRRLTNDSDKALCLKKLERQQERQQERAERSQCRKLTDQSERLLCLDKLEQNQQQAP